MTFKEFNSKVELSLYKSALEICMQPKPVMTLSEKVEGISKIVELYGREFEKITGVKPDIYEMMEAMRNHE